MRFKRSFLLLITFSVLGPSCKDNRTDFEKLVTEWQGKKIELIRDLECRVMGEDTVATELLDKPCKILIYVDSTGCTNCKLRLEEWKRLIAEVEPIRDRVSFLFCFHTKDEEMVNLMFLRLGVRYPIFFDPEGRMQQANHFAADQEAQTFLLNKKNKTTIVGSPVGNPVKWKLYRKMINKELKIKDEDWPEKADMGGSIY